MDWIKVLNRHTIFEYTDMTDAEFTAWIKIMSLTAYMERIPDRENMLRYAHHKTLTSLQDRLKNHSTTLQDILKKVLSDAQEVVRRRESWKNKRRKYRGVGENVPGDVTNHVPDKRREDKDIDKEKNKKTEVDIPSWIDRKTWDAFIEIRKKMKAPNTEHALRLITAKLEKLKLQGHDPNEVLNESISNGWRGVFPLKTTGRGTRNSSGGSGVQTTPPEWTGTLTAISEEQRQANIAKLKDLGCGVDED